MSRLAEQDVARVIQRYQDRIRQVGVSAGSLNSGSPEKQAVRHAVHAQAFVPEGRSVLDIGCGLADFYRFIKPTGRPVEYTGYDLVPDYVEACRRAHPEASFAVRNIFAEGIDGIFDTVVMSQVFNNRYAHSDNVAVLHTALRLAFEHSRCSVSVDMMSSDVDFQNRDLFYYSPEEMFRFAKTLTRRVVLRHDYRPFEFSLQLYHGNVGLYLP